MRALQVVRLTGPEARDQARAAIGVAPRGTVVWLLPRSVPASLLAASPSGCSSSCSSWGADR